MAASIYFMLWAAAVASIAVAAPIDKTTQTPATTVLSNAATTAQNYTHSSDRFQPNISDIISVTAEPSKETDLILSLKEAPISNQILSSGAVIPDWIDTWTAPKELVNYLPYYMSGYDNEGAPVYVLEIGKWRPQELPSLKLPRGREMVQETASKYIMQAIYRMHRDGWANNNQGIAVILDYDGFDLRNFADPFTIDYLLKALSYFKLIDSVLNYAFVINMNFAAENFTCLTKPFLSTILDKSEYFGPQKSKWLHHVLRRIPKSELPPWYGGEQSWRPVWIGGSGGGTASNSTLS